VNQADEVESIGHGRELAPDSIPGKKESAIEHGDELSTHILSVRVRLAELISTEIQGWHASVVVSVSKTRTYLGNGRDFLGPFFGDDSSSRSGYDSVDGVDPTLTLLSPGAI
jgi:hypothetical protein